MNRPLESSKALVDAVFECGPVGYVVLDDADRVQEWSRHAERLFGWAASEVRGQPFPSLAARSFADFAAVARAAAQTHCCQRWQAIARAGGPVLVRLWAQALVGAAPGWLLVALEDERDQRLYEQAVRQSERRFSILSDMLSDVAVFTVDEQGCITSWSDGAQRLLGYHTSEVLGKSMDILAPPPEGAGVAPSAELVKAREMGRHRVESLRQRRDGRLFPATMMLAALSGEDGRERGFLQVLRDDTERGRTREALRQSEQRLLHSQKMEAVGRLASGIAHDFNNLLTAVNGYSELALCRLNPGDPLHSELLEIRRAGERGEALTRQLLGFSRRQVAQPRILDPNALVLDLERLLRRLIGEDIELVLNLDPTAGSICVDPGQLEQVLLNLAVNSRDALHGGGTLTIETRSAQALHGQVGAPGAGGAAGCAQVVIAVTDDGTGMDAATRARVFEPFFTTKPIGKGTGLGLSTVDDIVQQCGGRIELESELCKGTSVRLYLPRVGEGSPRPADRDLQLEDPRGSERVLVIEDDDGIRSLVREALHSYGYQVETARDGDEALRLLRSTGKRVELLLADVVLPHMNGLELARRVRELVPEVRVLFMSGYADDNLLPQGVRDAGVNFIQKPFTPQSLARRIRSVLGAAPPLLSTLTPTTAATPPATPMSPMVPTTPPRR